MEVKKHLSAPYTMWCGEAQGRTSFQLSADVPETKAITMRPADVLGGPLSDSGALFWCRTVGMVSRVLGLDNEWTWEVTVSGDAHWH